MARARSVGRPNDYDWELSRGTSLGVAAGSIVQFEAFLADTAETLVRLRGEVLIWLDISGATAGDLLVVAWGLIRGPSGSSDVGVSPLTEGGANYVAFGVAHLGRQIVPAAGTSGPTPDGLTMMRFHVDSKAMRKFREDESLYVIFETVDVTGAPTANLSFAIRGLTAR